MNSIVYVGLAVTAHNNQNVNTSTFTEVTVKQTGAAPKSFGPEQIPVPPQRPPASRPHPRSGAWREGDPTAGAGIGSWLPPAGHRESKETAGLAAEPARQAHGQRQSAPVNRTDPLEVRARAAPGAGPGIGSGKPTELDRLESSPDGADCLFALWELLDDWSPLVASEDAER
jgi:hypothetical protein